jgi:hypothetical protein
MLDSLRCGNNNLIELDLTKNIMLSFLQCDSNNLTKLNLTKNINLKKIHCNHNNLIELDVSNNVKLEHLDCSYNNLIKLVTNNVYMRHLDCCNNNLIELDVSGNIMLEYLDCLSNNLTELDVSNNINLIQIDCGNNNLIKLDVYNNANFIMLLCDYNKLKFSTIPIDNVINHHRILYAPQDTIYGEIRKYTDTIDLSNEYNVNGYITNYEWVDITSGEEKEIIQPINKNGVFAFTEEHADKKLRCKMKNEQFPGHINTVPYPFVIVYEINVVNITNELLVNIYPNPISDFFTVSFDLEKHSNVKIILTDLLGKEILEVYDDFTHTGPFIKNINITKLAKSVYFLNIFIDGEYILVEKIIKN